MSELPAQPSVKTAEKLLWFDVREGWEPLCEFLGVDVPDVPFPHEFRRKDLLGGREALLGRLRKRMAVLVGLVGLGGGLVGWACRRPLP